MPNLTNRSGCYKPTSKTDRNGSVSSYTYDGLGRLTSTSVTANGDQSTVTTQYYITGVKKQETSGYITQTYTYDSLNRIITEQENGVVKQ